MSRNIPLLTTNNVDLTDTHSANTALSKALKTASISTDQASKTNNAQYIVKAPNNDCHVSFVLFIEEKEKENQYSAHAFGFDGSSTNATLTAFIKQQIEAAELIAVHSYLAEDTLPADTTDTLISTLLNTDRLDTNLITGLAIGFKAGFNDPRHEQARHDLSKEKSKNKTLEIQITEAEAQITELENQITALKKSSRTPSPPTESAAATPQAIKSPKKNDQQAEIDALKTELESLAGKAESEAEALKQALENTQATLSEKTQMLADSHSANAEFLKALQELETERNALSDQAKALATENEDLKLELEEKKNRPKTVYSDDEDDETPLSAVFEAHSETLNQELAITRTKLQAAEEKTEALQQTTQQMLNWQKIIDVCQAMEEFNQLLHLKQANVELAKINDITEKKTKKTAIAHQTMRTWSHLLGRTPIVDHQNEDELLALLTEAIREHLEKKNERSHEMSACLSQMSELTEKLMSTGNARVADSDRIKYQQLITNLLTPLVGDLSQAIKAFLPNYRHYLQTLKQIQLHYMLNAYKSGTSRATVNSAIQEIRKTLDLEDPEDSLKDIELNQTEELASQCSRLLDKFHGLSTEKIGDITFAQRTQALKHQLLRIQTAITMNDPDRRSELQTASTKAISTRKENKITHEQFPNMSVENMKESLKKRRRGSKINTVIPVLQEAELLLMLLIEMYRHSLTLSGISLTELEVQTAESLVSTYIKEICEPKYAAVHDLHHIDNLSVFDDIDLTSDEPVQLTEEKKLRLQAVHESGIQKRKLTEEIYKTELASLAAKVATAIKTLITQEDTQSDSLFMFLTELIINNSTPSNRIKLIHSDDTPDILKNELRARNAASTIQRSFRASMRRKEENVRQSAAALTIQSIFRGHLVRKRLKEEPAAATLKPPGSSFC